MFALLAFLFFRFSTSNNLHLRSKSRAQCRCSCSLVSFFSPFYLSRLMSDSFSSVPQKTQSKTIILNKQMFFCALAHFAHLFLSVFFFFSLFTPMKTNWQISFRRFMQQTFFCIALNVVIVYSNDSLLYRKCFIETKTKKNNDNQIQLKS